MRDITMRDTLRSLTVLSTSLCTAILLQACSGKSAPSTASERVRGTVQSLNGQVLTVTTPGGPVRVQLAPSTPVATVVPSDRAHITDGSFLGIGSVTEPDGSLRAAEITVFPESKRGTGEGSYPWSGPAVSGGGNMTNGTASSMNMTNGTASASTMTNGTASASTMTNGTASSTMTNGTASAKAGGSSLTLTYKDGASRGAQTIAIPPGIPVVALEPGAQADLRPGVHVLVLASRGAGGALTAARVLAGKNGLVPPM
jgi:hypothetical protein